MRDPKRQEYIVRFVQGMQRGSLDKIERLANLKQRVPFAYRLVRAISTSYAKKHHFGQVLPLEEAQQVLDMVHSVTRIACVCRSVTKKKQNARYCLLLGIDPTGLSFDWQELRQSLEVLTISEAKALLEEFDEEGLVHSIWTFNTPFIGAICNCDRDCLAYKAQISGELLELMFKAESLAEIDPDSCTGCRRCMSFCQFGAMEYSAVDKKVVVHPIRCYGCGLCRRRCLMSAITLVEKRL